MIFNYYTCLLLCFLFCACNQSSIHESEEVFSKPAIDPNPSSVPLSPEKSMQNIHLPPGYRLELVASEPVIEEPVAIAWDGNGKMYVAEMRTYMQDVEGSGTDQPISRIMLLEDTNNDGKMDKHTVYIDSLLLPRMILPLEDRLLISETYTYDLWSYKDVDGDGKADEKIRLFQSDKIDTRNLEHQASGLDWNLDNWIYVGRDLVRFKYRQGKIEVDSLYDAPHSQWGVTHDDYGRLFFSNAGGEIPALGFQQNPAYGTVELDEQLSEDFQDTWPIMATVDAQGGFKRLREDSTLNHFTASCGQSIFRGENLPEDLRGDLLICEPVGRFIRRAKVVNQEGMRVVKNAYVEKEFLASTDMNFRPVNTATGPDGCLYIVDMYRGIIQESNWTKEGTYIRSAIKRHGLDNNIGRGRIYRLVHEDFTPGPSPKMLEETSEQLVKHLAHPNGWWRDNAQRLIVLRGDESVVPDLKDLALGKQPFLQRFFGEKPGAITRIHALWTLEGLEALDKETVLQALEDLDVEVRKTAIWLSEIFLKKGDEEILAKLKSLKNDPDTDIQHQLILSLRYGEAEGAKLLIEEIREENKHNELIVAAAKKSLEDKDEHLKLLKTRIASYQPHDRNRILNGANYFKQTCAVCHGNDGRGITIGGTNNAAPPLAGSERVNGNKEVLVKILLNGLTGPVDGKEYPADMPPMDQNDDEWIASVLSYIRNDFGNKASIVRAQEVEEVRKETKERDRFWTLQELELLHKTN